MAHAGTTPFVSEWLPAAEKAKALFKPDYVKQKAHNGQDVIISSDIEGTGVRPEENKMIALGVTVGTGAIWPADGKSAPIIPPAKVLDKFRVCFPIEAKDLAKAFEPRSVYEYWLKDVTPEVKTQEQKAQLLLFEQESRLQTAKESATKFLNVVKKYQTDYKTVYLVGDNLTYDLPFINSMLYHHLDHTPLFLSTLDQRTYSNQIVSWQELAMKHRATVSKVLFNAQEPDKKKHKKRGSCAFAWDGDAIDSLVGRMTKVTHDHMPENDAEVNYYRAYVGAYYDAPYTALEAMYPK